MKAAANGLRAGIRALVEGSADEPITRQFMETVAADPAAAGSLDWRIVRRKEFCEDRFEAEILVTPEIEANVLRCAPDLRWIHVLSAGTDGSITEELKSSQVTITNSSGVHETPIAEHVLGVMLMFARQLQRCVRQQIRHEWDRDGFREEVTEVGGSTAGIIGLGAIGQGLASRCKALGMRVIAVRRHPELGSRDTDLLLPPAELPRLLAESDYIVICAPLTRETGGLISDAEFALMKPGCVLINVARGRIVDSEALVGALRRGVIAGAGLDAADPEPLPPDSPLWDMPNVIISPHVSGLNPHYGRRAAGIFLHNLHLYLEGRQSEFLNLLDPELWY